MDAKKFFKKLNSSLRYIARKFEFPAILLLFLETSGKLRSLYLQDGLSFFDNVFSFQLILMSSFRIVRFLCYKKKIKICLQHCDVIFPPKTVKIEKQKSYDSLE